jgi:hypothetical protein
VLDDESGGERKQSLNWTAKPGTNFSIVSSQLRSIHDCSLSKSQYKNRDRVVNLTAQPQFNASTLHITCFFRANRGFSQISQLESSFLHLWFAKSDSKVSN